MKTTLLLLAVPACAAALAQTTSPAEGQQPFHHNFQLVAMGKAVQSKGATATSVHRYESEAGTFVVQLREWYKSATDAHNGLDTLTKRASRITRQGTKKDEKGRIVGRRVELVLSHGHKASPEMVIAWTDGATVVELSSKSLPLLLDFESQNYPDKGETTPSPD